MSYEGCECWLCHEGHEHYYDVYDLPNKESWRCCECGKGVSCIGQIDETNVPTIQDFRLVRRNGKMFMRFYQKWVESEKRRKKG